MKKQTATWLFNAIVVKSTWNAFSLDEQARLQECLRELKEIADKDGDLPVSSEPSPSKA